MRRKDDSLEPHNPVFEVWVSELDDICGLRDPEVALARHSSQCQQRCVVILEEQRSTTTTIDLHQRISRYLNASTIDYRCIARTVPLSARCAALR